MNLRSYSIFIIFVTCFLWVKTTNAQDTVSRFTETQRNIRAAQNYLNGKISSLKKYAGHRGKIQKRLLRKLSRKEKQMAGLDKNKRNDINDGNPDFDSLKQLSNNQDALNYKKQIKGNETIDSLKRIWTYLKSEKRKLSHLNKSKAVVNLSPNYNKKLQTLENQLDAQQRLEHLIIKRKNALKQSLPQKDFSVLLSMNKDIAIAQSKIKYWKRIYHKPDKVEQKAYDYLRGIKGFNSSLKSKNKAFGGVGNNPSLAKLKEMGYQPKGMLKRDLQQHFGQNLDNVQKIMGQQIKAYQKVMHKVKSKTQAVKTLAKNAKNVKKSLGKIEQPAFKNPMRGLPFLMRWQPRFNFQSIRALYNRPAMLNFSGGLAYKETKHLKMGFGMSVDFGLGKDWQHIHFSYEGIGLNAFVDYDVIFGIAVEGGYERVWRPINRPYIQAADNSNDFPLDNNRKTTKSGNWFEKVTGVRQQIAYIGLTKSYRINDKWHGIFMVGYNFLWQRNGMRSPVVLKIGWEK